LIGLLQRVTQARVDVDGMCIGAIDQGLMVLIGVERDDNEAKMIRLLDRILGYRIFADADGKMNLGLQDVGGGLLLVPQFTLLADTRKGRRPSFTPAAPPQQGKELFGQLCTRALVLHPKVATGEFGVDMQVTLTNDGPVTFWLQV
jgi:D-aminoacyl-tRNA deacylase